MEISPLSSRNIQTFLGLTAFLSLIYTRTEVQVVDKLNIIFDKFESNASIFFFFFSRT